MGKDCGCKNKKPKFVSVEEQANTEYVALANGGAVKLGLKHTFKIPIRFPASIDDQDVIVVANKRQIPIHGGSIVITGRNALIDPEHKQQLVEKWPAVFSD